MEGGELYGLPLERFIEERDALAKRLRGRGQREEGAEVARLRKPSVAAWAVNQLVRTRRREVDALFKAGDALQKAQEDLLARRGDPTTLREAADSERAAVGRLVERTRSLLSSDGHEPTPARLEQVSETLHAGALDREARSRVREGRLDRELRHIGLGALAGGPPAGAPSERTARRSSRSAAGGETSRQRRAGLSAARKAETGARRQLERAVRELKAADERHQRAQVELRQATEALAAAREVSEQAAREHEQARKALEKLG